MKVVLFCGGLGLRMRDYAEHIPKPMVPIGYRPILWHVMKYYAHFGHKDFILCLGYRGDTIKQYFLNYNECLSNDFIFKDGGKELELYNGDIQDWRITFVDTGTNSNIGERLRRVEKYLDGEEQFLANYSDGLTDLDLNKYLEFVKHQNKIGTFVSVKPNLSYHVVENGPDGIVQSIKELSSTGLRINCGFFVFKKEVFKYLLPGEELVMEPFRRLIQMRQLAAFEYDGFFAAMDTFKDRQHLEDLYESGEPPWQVWKSNGLTQSDALIRRAAGKPKNQKLLLTERLT